MDVDQDESVQWAVDYVMSKTGRIDVVVNNAGFGISGAIEDTPISTAKAQLETNFFGVLRVCHAVLPAMRERGLGYIVNVTSLGLPGAILRSKVRRGGNERSAADGGPSIWRPRGTRRAR